MSDKKNTLILSVDLEDIRHLEYFQSYKNFNKITAIDNVYIFLEKLKENNLKATFFVLLDVVIENHILITDIIKEGHEIALHGFDHELLYKKDKNIIFKQLYEAKMHIEDKFSISLKGYRAPCFSIFNGFEDILVKLGMKYDSSYVNFLFHSLYGKYDLSGWNRIKKNLYEKNGLLEFEIPRINFFNFNVPYGGGYFRMFPWIVQDYLFNNVFNNFDPLVVYLHPFELKYKKIIFPDKVRIMDDLRFNLGRRSVSYKIDKLLNLGNYKITNFSQYIKELKK